MLIFAHPQDDVLNKLSTGEATTTYLKLGFEHIIPLGLDHILFVICLFLLKPKLRPILMQSLAFTVAHTITLGLSMYSIIKPPLHIVEPLIALSIVFLALENCITNTLKPTRIFVVFIFGLIHGLGFASVLNDLGLPQNKFLLSLVAFNVGVEIGQVVIILSLWFLIAKWFANKLWYRNRIVVPVSIIISIIAMYWIFERVFLIN